MKLLTEAILKFALGVTLIAGLLLIPAGTWLYWNAWLLMGLLFIPMFIAGLMMLKKNPNLLRSRLNAKEKAGEQQLVVKLSGLMFLLGFITAGLDLRFGWSHLPKGLIIASCAAFLLAYALYAEVLRENVWLSRTIEVQEHQKVVDTGLYGIVRHPMYAVTFLLFGTMPLILGSLPALLIFLFYPFIIAKRIRSEEQILSQELEGYTDYCKRVKYRLIPLIW